MLKLAEKEGGSLSSLCPLCKKKGLSVGKLVPNCTLNNIINWFLKQRSYRATIHRIELNHDGTRKKKTDQDGKKEGSEDEESDGSDDYSDFEKEIEKTV